MSFNDALKLYKQGNTFKAHQLLQEVVKKEPKNENAWALLLKTSTDEQEQQQVVKKLLALNPHHPAALEYQTQHHQNLNAESSEKIYEMLWDCEYCNAKKLLGKTHRFCPNCGAPQDANARYFPEEKDKVAVQDHQYFGADKICSACGTANSAKAEFCQQCGNSLGDGKAVKQQTEQVQGRDGKFHAINEKPPENKNSNSNSTVTWLVVLGIVLLVGIWAVLFWNKEVKAVVTGHHWQRIIEVEEFGERQKEDWCNVKPSDAYRISKEEKVRSTRKVADGQECTTHKVDKGDGTYAEKQECQPRYREEPVYDDYCHYSVNRWEVERKIETHGDDKKPYWGKVSLAKEGNCMGCEREGDRKESYQLLLKQKESEDSHVCDVEQELWQKTPVDATFKVDVNLVTGSAHCGSLKLIK